MAEVFTFDERTAEELVRLVRRNLSRILPTELRKQSQPVLPKPLHYHAKITETVTPASDDTPGFGKGEIYRYDTGTETMKLLWEEPQVIRTVAPAAVHPMVWVPVHVDAWGDFWTETDSGIKIFKTPSGGIPARTGAAMPGVLCTLQRVVVDSVSGDRTPTPSLDSLGNPIQQMVYNQGKDAVGELIEIQAVLIDGQMVANWEDCSVAQ